MADHSAYKLGRKPARFDPRIPEFGHYLTTQLPPSPPVCDWTQRVADWRMLKNDVEGDCTSAGCGHQIMGWSANASTQAAITDQDAESFYSASCGYDPSNQDTDQGGVELDVLTYWHKNGYAGHKLDAFASLDVGNRTNVKDAIWILGGVYIGVNLPISAQNQEQWQVPSQGLTGDGAPGSWGGHCVVCLGYTDQYVAFVSWGKVMTMTWDFWNSYVEEAWGLVSKEWLKANGVSPSGFKYDDLISDMKAIGSTPLDNLRDVSDDPILLEFKWNELTIDIKQAAATWVVGLLASALAAHGYINDSGLQTWAGVAAVAFATWSHLTTIHKMNWTTADFVGAISDVIDIIQRSKKQH